MAVDGISMLLLIAGVVVVLFALFKSGKNKTITGVLGVIIVVVGLAGAGGYVNYGNFGKGSVQTQTYVNPTSNQQQQALSVAGACSANAITSNSKSQADIVARNVLNTSGTSGAAGGYLSGSVSANSAAGSLIDSATTTAGTTPSYVSMSNIPNCGVGSIIGTVTTGIGFASSRQVKDVETGNLVSGYDFRDKGVHKYELQTSSADVLSCEFADYSNAVSSSWQTNGSVGAEVVKDANGHLFVSGTGTADGNFYFKNTSLLKDGTINFHLRCQVNGSMTNFGAYSEPDGFSIAYNPGALSRFSPGSLTLGSDTPGWALTKVDCPNDITYNRNAKACWSAPSMKAGILYEMRGTLTDDLTDVVIGDTMPLIALDDRQFYRDTTTLTRYSAWSTAGTNIGVGGTIANFVLN